MFDENRNVKKQRSYKIRRVIQICVVILVVITRDGHNTSVIVRICRVQRVQVTFTPYWRGGYGRQVGKMAILGADVKTGELSLNQKILA